MSRNGSGTDLSGALLCCAFSVARLAAAISVFVRNEVVRRVFVSLRAVSLSALPSPVRFSSKGQASGVYAFLLAQNIGKPQAICGARNNRVRFDSGAFRKLYGQVLNSINDHLARTSLIALLLRSRRPSAIVWRVWAIVVNAVYAVPVRARPHVGYKVQKPDFGLKPSVTHDNAASAVVAIKLVARRVASALHAFPDGSERVRRLFHVPIMACNGIGSK